MMSIDLVLRNTLSPDQHLREEATQTLERLANENLAQYSIFLCQALANESSDGFVRSAAGIALKNAFRARTAQRQEIVVSQWLAVEDAIKSQIKSAILFVLGSSDNQAASAAAQVIQAIATIEIPLGRWTDLVDILLDNMTNSNSSAGLKRATLQAIGFVCEEVNPKYLQSWSDRILTAVIQGARREEPDITVRKEAINALYNSLEFVERNFENKGERDFIMNVLFDGLQSENLSISAISFQCLVKVMQLYYGKMKDYMIAGLYAKTIAGMQSPHPEIALQAIEFWSTVCDVEIDIIDGAIDEDLLNFASSAVGEIIPVLYKLLCEKDDDEDEEDWNVPMAAATCLSQFSICVRDQIIQPHSRILEFIQKDLISDNPKQKESAVLSFGSIMDGPSTEVIGNQILAALPHILRLLKDNSVSVRDSSAFTLQKICQHHAEVIGDSAVSAVIESLCDSLNDSPRVASNAAWAIMNLSESFKDLSLESRISPYFGNVAHRVIMAANRPDAHEKNLRMAAYQSISALIHVAGPENIKFVVDITSMLIQSLHQTLSANIVSVEDHLQITDLQSYICSYLMNACNVLEDNVKPLADNMMSVYLDILKGNQGKKTPVVEDVMLSIGALANALGEDFSKYSSSFIPFLFEALKNHEEEQLCSVAIGLTGDIARALKSGISIHCDILAELLLRILQNASIGRELKTASLATFGDLAMAIEDHFEKYLQVTVNILFQAGSISIDTSNPDDFEYMQDLYIAILDTFANFVQGMKKPDHGSKALFQYLPSIIEFIKFVAQNTSNSESVVRGAVGLLGDICDAYGSEVSTLYKNSPWIMSYINSVLASPNLTEDQTKSIATWAISVISKV